ncbi:hypothetical protein DFH07DRAFT_962311 [Mycena maculata]|uniref:Tyr recombinase domain-containing protein n=1 Tax=Mycena maculata TaxID=230809 RepID=A0AAD7N6K9_9AGAR|nr:hypothetical protein DFH07DRAFT_962311 [Mycena maculata]
MLHGYNTTGAPLTRSYALRTLDDCLKRAGYDSSEFSGHSFRRGAAFAAAEAGYTPEQIKLLGRWKSNVWKLYVNQPLSILRNLSVRLHRVVLPIHPCPISTPPSHRLTIQLPAHAPAPSPLRVTIPSSLLPLVIPTPRTPATQQSVPLGSGGSTTSLIPSAPRLPRRSAVASPSISGTTRVSPSPFTSPSPLMLLAADAIADAARPARGVPICNHSIALTRAEATCE